ncbi:MAG: hypothetical protein ACR2OJ_10170 [Hyphomicrobiales bacterium]
MDLAITLTVMALALCGVIWMILLEKRPKDPTRPLLVPTTPLMFLLLLVFILAAAHLMTIVTGKPHLGRF